MKNLLLITIIFFSLQSVFGQNGLQNGNLFILPNNKNSITINSFEDNKINELKSFSVSNKSIYTTDQKSKIAVLDTAKNDVKIFDIQTSQEIELSIPFDIKPKTILLKGDNLFIGGEMGEEMLVQYQLKLEKWYKLEIPNEVMFIGKAIDDLVVKDSLLIAIDNLIMPKYILFYDLNTDSKLEISHYKELKSNGSYESIHQGRITEKYFGLISGTFSGYVGASEHITIYDNLNLKNSFALSTNEQDKDYHTFTDFAIIGDKIIIATKEKGVGIFRIKKSYFKDSDKLGNKGFNSRVNISKINYEKFKNETITKITIVPNTNKTILTYRNRLGKLRHEVREF